MVTPKLKKLLKACFHKMMILKKLLLTLVIAFPISGWSQQVIVPNKNVVDQKWIHNQDYKMRWLMVRDTIKVAIGEVDYSIKIVDDKIQVITDVKMKGSPASWIDTTIVSKQNLSPIYHSSYNAQRNMSLAFGKDVKGFYLDKTVGKSTNINENVPSGYFDSNFYPILISWLPLNTAYKATLSIFDYNPKGKTGVLKANVLNVKEASYISIKLGERKVWEVEVADEISSDSKSIYYFDQLTRQLYKQKIIVGGRVMEMVLVEE